MVGLLRDDQRQEPGRQLEVDGPTSIFGAERGEPDGGRQLAPLQGAGQLGSDRSLRLKSVASQSQGE